METELYIILIIIVVLCFFFIKQIFNRKAQENFNLNVENQEKIRNMENFNKKLNCMLELCKNLRKLAPGERNRLLHNVQYSLASANRVLPTMMPTHPPTFAPTATSQPIEIIQDITEPIYKKFVTNKYVIGEEGRQKEIPPGSEYIKNIREIPKQVTES